MAILFVVFSADEAEPPGEVIAAYWDRDAAEAYRDGPGDGYGYSIVEVSVPPTPLVAPVVVAMADARPSNPGPEYGWRAARPSPDRDWDDS
jgi:hypothetical protein